MHRSAYRAALKARHFAATEIQNMLQEEVIASANTKLASPTVFASKKNGSLTFYVEHHKRKAAILRDSYHLPRMDGCINFFKKVRVFSTVGGNYRHWQIEIEDQDKSITAFTIHHGVIQFVRIPFGLKHTPATSEPPIHVKMSSTKGQSSFKYLGDIVIFSKNENIYMAYL